MTRMAYPQSLLFFIGLVVGGCGPSTSLPEVVRQPATASGGPSSSSTAGAVSGGSTGGGTSAGMPTGGGTGGTTDQSATACPPGPYAASPLPANTTPQLLADSGVDWSEGPVWVRSGGYLLFSAWSDETQDSAGPRTTIYKYAPSLASPTNPNAALSVFSTMATLRSNGMAITDSGDVVVASDGDITATAPFDRGLERLPNAQLAQRQYIVNKYDALPFDAPNDLTIRHDGTMYMTDTDYQQGNPARPGQTQTRVYGITPAGQVSVVDANRPEPNGIALSIDQKTLYVGAADNQIMAYPVHTDGSVGTPTLFATPGADVDGMGVDCAGNVYASLPAEQKLEIYSPTGTLLGTLSLPQQNSNVAFGGADMKTLFMTVSGKLYGVTMPIPGWPY